MGRIAVIADRDTATLFKLAGVEASMVVDSPEEAERALRSLMEKDFSVIILTRQLVQPIQQTIAKLTRDKKYPVVIVIPGKGEPMEREVISIHEYLRRSLGVELKTKGV
ncbi:V-type ATP synthase subunit F [Candidatus Bathyarchaeota archaeon]|nr:V-type ATP synthase subunit F [Candidatus Bathyarchaeota archaeon]MBS7613602.1 V-type ATP synthase subunit F [Candidatus Bathyarchaeota archaeon]MBS7617145.1 V-type ATP synthase subunit F [Candidatus Bathyarchaeota archaeon]